MPWRVLLEPCPLLPIFATVALIAQPAYASEHAIATVAGAWCACILIKVPAAARFMHLRPTYLDDVSAPFEDERPEDAAMRERLTRYFDRTLIVSSSVALGCCVEYGLVRLGDTRLEVLELCGVTGGLLSLFSRAHVALGKAMITVLHWQRRRYGRRREAAVALAQAPEIVVA